MIFSKLADVSRLFCAYRSDEALAGGAFFFFSEKDRVALPVDLFVEELDVAVWRP
jgi:hypothetical protein